ncbi:divergent polysaccharide deacetylase family protein [Parvularcula bermudensis]|uniref:divergent polysaccharide deacetylase family protein n=1 Tax=Parvularcula bermudensis TaxID=208216 RepID=UPI0002DF54C5|nr:divergent polysaccharide deacetylase family protein [Parvularcula bermudensis]
MKGVAGLFLGLFAAGSALGTMVVLSTSPARPSPEPLRNLVVEARAAGQAASPHAPKDDAGSIDLGEVHLRSPSPPWRRVDFHARPRIALVIDDMGYSWAAYDRLNDLPVPLTMAFLPFSADAQEMIDALWPRHDAIVHLPMEPIAETHLAGPGMLSTDMDADAIKWGLLAALSQLRGYSGVNNHTGSRFTADRARMAVVLGELNRRGLFFLDSITTPRPVAHLIAEAEGFSVLERNVFLDSDYDTLTSQQVRTQLAKLERIAQSEGQAIGIGHPYAITLDVVERWAEDVEARGFSLVLVKDLAPRPRHRTLADLR